MILISTRTDDVHANMVLWALQKLGVAAAPFFPGAIAENITSYSFLANPNGTRLVSSLDELNSSIDLIWFRRSPTALRVVNTADGLDDYEKANIDETVSQYAWEVQNYLAQAYPHVNAPIFTQTASNKLLQMKFALECGFEILPTAIGADPIHAKDVASSMSKEFLFKPYRHNVWKLAENKFSNVPSTVIGANDIPKFDLPGIMQEPIQKREEYRVCVFGNKVVSVVQRPLSDAAPQIDWRLDMLNKFEFEVADLPDHIFEAAIRLTKKFNLQFSALDLIQSNDGTIYFLELNPGGQFLYIGDIVPQTNILATCVEALLGYAGLDGIAIDPDVINTRVFWQENAGFSYSKQSGTGNHFLDKISRRSLSPLPA